MDLFNKLYTAPDFSSPIDLGLVCLGTFFAITAAVGNKLQVPLFARGNSLLSYSKFAQGVKAGIDVPSRVGMTLMYAPACALGAYYLVKHATTTRTQLCATLMMIHFGKRVLECLFLHKYSGSMPLATGLFVSTFYSTLSLITCYYSSQSPALAYSSSDDLLAGYTSAAGVGMTLFALGVCGNFYHHYLLATLRKPGEKGYKLPVGGFFTYVAAPHYLFELVGWFGVSLVTKHSISFLYFIAMSSYLFERADAQHNWNLVKLKEVYPKSRKRILPFFW
jgi:very-long-chain enoyl-CoA reductase